MVGHAVDFLDEIGEVVDVPSAPVRMDDAIIVILDARRDRESGIHLELDFHFRLDLERRARQERKRGRKVEDGAEVVEGKVQREPLPLGERLARFEPV